MRCEFTLWYAFLISALVAERWMFRTSMLVSDLSWLMGLRERVASTVEVDFLGHDCVCIGGEKS